MYSLHPASTVWTSYIAYKTFYDEVDDALECAYEETTYTHLSEYTINIFYNDLQRAVSVIQSHSDMIGYKKLEASFRNKLKKVIKNRMVLCTYDH